jgi:hypothetical protein
VADFLALWLQATMHLSTSLLRISSCQKLQTTRLPKCVATPAALPRAKLATQGFEKITRPHSNIFGKLIGPHERTRRSEQRTETQQPELNSENELPANTLKGVLILIAAFAFSSVVAADGDDDEEKVEPLSPQVGAWRQDLPVFTRAEVQKHKNKENRYIFSITRVQVCELTFYLPGFGLFSRMEFMISLILSKSILVFVLE